MRIGIVGSGKIGGLVGTLWSRAGHEMVFSSRHPENLAGLVALAGNGAKAGTPEEAIAFGDVVLLSIPLASLPAFGRERGELLGRKPVLDTSNPFPSRDGPMAEEVRQSGRGTGPYLRASGSSVRSTPYWIERSRARRIGLGRGSAFRSHRMTKRHCRLPPHW